MISFVLSLLLLVNPVIGYYYCCAHNEFIMGCHVETESEHQSGHQSEHQSGHQSERQSEHQSEHSCLIHSQAVYSAPTPRAVLDGIQSDLVSNLVVVPSADAAKLSFFENYFVGGALPYFGTPLLHWFCILII